MPITFLNVLSKKSYFTAWVKNWWSQSLTSGWGWDRRRRRRRVAEMSFDEMSSVKGWVVCAEFGKLLRVQNVQGTGKKYDFAAQNGKSVMRCNDVTFYNIDFRNWIPGCLGLPTTKTTGNFFFSAVLRFAFSFHHIRTRSYKSFSA